MSQLDSRELALWRDGAFAHELIDVRREAARQSLGAGIPGAEWRDPAAWLDWKDLVPRDRPVVLACAHGHEISQGLCAALRAMGVDARFLSGGIAAWAQQGRAMQALSASVVQGSRWVTRARPKIDRIACPWLVLRFIDPAASFFYVPAQEVMAVAGRLGAEPFDVPDVALGHQGDLCSFDAFLARYTLNNPALTDPALMSLADIVRGADTSRLDLSPESAGLLAVSLGLSARFADDQEMLRHGLFLYDTLYAWCKSQHPSVG